MVNKFNKKSQSFSTDILVVIVVLLFGVLFLVANKISDNDNGDKINSLVDKANVESRLIFDELKKSKVIDSESNINVNSLKQVDIQNLKEELNIRGDFCIVFEKDGYLVKIDSDNNINGVGSQNIIVNNVPCKFS